MLNLDLKNHPYEIKYNGMVKWAKEHHRQREAGPAKPKVIEDHIIPKETDWGWGMFNYRLNEWVFGDDRTGDAPMFKNEELAISWYRSLL